MKRNNTSRARLLLAKIEKERDSKRIVAFKDSLFVSKDFYAALQFLVEELGWNTLVETREFKQLSGLVIALAEELREKKRMEAFHIASGASKREKKQAGLESAPAQELTQQEGGDKSQSAKESVSMEGKKENKAERFRLKTSANEEQGGEQ